MLYFANPCGPEVLQAMVAGELGFIATPCQGNARPEGVIWCADNGCYGKGYPGDQEWLRWLHRRSSGAADCRFATAPDVVGDARATAERSLPWLPEIRKAGYPAGYVAQDGQEDFEPPWGNFDALFIGGTTEWKLGPCARRLVAQAKALGKWVHMGRVNSKKRLVYAARIGCDSADGTFLTFGPKQNLPRLRKWFEGLEVSNG